MNPVHFNLEYSPWYFLLCLIIGGSYAAFLYTKKYSWSKPLNNFLAVIRGVLVTLICFLLLNLTLDTSENKYEKPILVIGVDGSYSMSFAEGAGQIKQKVARISDLLNEKGFKVDLKNVSGGDSISFDASQTNLSSFLSQTIRGYRKQHLTDVLLVTDGITNDGISPKYLVSNIPVHTIGLGDTLQKNDLLISDVKFNKTVFQGNRFPIEVSIEAIGFEGENAEINIFRGDTLLDSKKFSFSSNEAFIRTTFYDEAKVEGVQKYRVSVSRLDNELTYDNNTRELFVKVVESKEKVLIYAAAPHPDIKVLKRVIEKNENYDVDIVIKSINPRMIKDKYSLAILHQSFDGSLIAQLRKDNTPLFFVVTPQADINLFNSVNNCLTIPRSRSQDEVSPSFVKTFDRFELNDQLAIFSEAPPLEVPFANYKIKAGAEVLAYQSVSGIETKREMILLNSQSRVKEGVFVGNGLWQWSLFEYQYHESHALFDQFFSKLMEYMSLKQDKRKFKVDLVNTQVFSNEQLIFEVELFNDLFENVYEQAIQFEISSDSFSKSYEFINSEFSNTFKTDKLKAGVYKYVAKTTLGNQENVVKGEVIVRDLKLEERNLSANYQGLRELSKNNGGQFFMSSEDEKIESFIRNLQPQNKIVSKQIETGIYKFWWVFVLLIVLVSTEWTLRKYHGEY